LATGNECLSGQLDGKSKTIFSLELKIDVMKRNKEVIIKLHKKDVTAQEMGSN